MWDSATDMSQSLHSLSLGEKHNFLALNDDSELISCAKEESAQRGIMLVQSVDVEASGSDWPVSIQPQARYSKVEVLLSLTNKHLYLAVASSSLGVHASLLSAGSVRIGKEKIGNGLGDQPLRTGIPCSRSTSDEAQQEPAPLKGCLQ